VRLATPDDLEVILGLIDDAADWLRTRKTSQWSKPWPNRLERDLRVVRGLMACRTWLVEDNGIPVATVTYREDGNHDLWTPEERLDPAAYMSRLVISRRYAGLGVGAELTDWAGARARREFRAETLRIDVWTDNYRLHEYYMGHGFSFVRQHKDDAYPSAVLLAKPTEDIKVAPESLFREVRAIAAGPVRPGPRATAPRTGSCISSTVLNRPEMPKYKIWYSEVRSHATVRKCLSAARDHGHLRHRKRHSTIATWTHLVTLITAHLFTPGNLSS
jgi:ribosomal protein S18 acetylase RimI-like enzyme